MSNCCSENNSSNSSDKKLFPRKQACPANQNNYVLTSLKTVLHHIKTSWNAKLKEQGYYFCHDPKCDVVYFGEDGSVIKTSELRTTISVKQNEDDDLICYCFGIKRKDAKNDCSIKEFVIKQTKIGNCSCETSNPSGRCCLKDFPK